jgi:hypothetical protein
MKGKNVNIFSVRSRDFSVRIFYIAKARAEADNGKGYLYAVRYT